MTASHPADDLASHLDLLATIDEFLRSPTIRDQLAAFLTTTEAAGPTRNGMLAACTLIDLFSFSVAGLRHPPEPLSTDQR
ncbi:hypothetical protein AB0F17_66310 [Nonomuraea sp. NPDC026600]|uniref:hypothetical protein n=1 Tax=Nonomuraea sp. NPDC026600 TaxID=3155363 RepID=UPI0033F692A5